MKKNVLNLIISATVFCLCLIKSVNGQSVPASSAPQKPVPTDSKQMTPTSASSRPYANSLSGDWDGMRTDLHNSGADFSLSYVGEPAANPFGGVATGAAYAQQFALGVDLDFQKLIDVDGLKGHFLFISRIGTSLSAKRIHNIFEVQEVYGNDEAPHCRIVFLTLEQSLLQDKINFLAGRTNAGADFANSPLFGNFEGVSIDYHPNSLPLNGGFNVFPFSLWGGRVAIKPMDNFYIKAGAYQVDPGLDYRPAFDWGTDNATGVILPFEMGYTPSFGPDKLIGHYKVGGFWDTSGYPDDRIETPATLADLNSEKVSNQDGRGAVYFLADQMVDRTGAGDQQGTVLLGGLTLSDPSTSYIDLFGYGGALMRGYVPGRPDDTIGLLAAYGHVNHRVSDTERIEANLGENVGIQTGETTLELAYGWQVSNWVRLSPNIQGIIHPGGTGQIPDALVLGVKMDAQF